MPEDLLQELKTAGRVAGSFESVEELVREAMTHAAQVGLAVQGLSGSALAFENIWRRIIMHVSQGKGTEIHAGRPGLLSVFDKRLSLLKQTHALATGLRKRGSAEVPDPDVLLPEIAGMERLKARVFDRWQNRARPGRPGRQGLSADNGRPRPDRSAASASRLLLCRADNRNRYLLAEWKPTPRQSHKECRKAGRMQF
jgi:hypothetical protein